MQHSINLIELILAYYQYCQSGNGVLNWAKSTSSHCLVLVQTGHALNCVWVFRNFFVNRKFSVTFGVLNWISVSIEYYLLDSVYYIGPVSGRSRLVDRFYIISHAKDLTSWQSIKLCCSLIKGFSPAYILNRQCRFDITSLTRVTSNVGWSGVLTQDTVY